MVDAISGSRPVSARRQSPRHEPHRVPVDRQRRRAPRTISIVTITTAMTGVAPGPQVPQASTVSSFGKGSSTGSTSSVSSGSTSGSVSSASQASPLPSPSESACFSYPILPRWRALPPDPRPCMDYRPQRISGERPDLTEVTRTSRRDGVIPLPSAPCDAARSDAPTAPAVCRSMGDFQM